MRLRYKGQTLNQSYKTIMELEVVGAAGVDSGHATSNLKQTNILDGEKGDPESGPEAEALMSQQVRIAPGQAAIELGSAPPLQPKRGKMDASWPRGGP